jgi:glyoxylase-like metal-dependent hydrolase (beta-lactamase superfamily II)
VSRRRTKSRRQLLRRLLLALTALLGLGVAALAAILALAHLEIRRRDPPLPSDAEVLALATAADAPSAVAWQLTASQALPRSQVLDPALDPDTGAPYVMSHPSFALAWPDGRLLLVDVGMEREAALAFGRPLGWLGGGPIAVSGGAASALGPAAERVAAVLFTHLHADHVEGVLALCEARGGAKLAVPQTAAQADLVNHTTRPGRRLLERAGCLAPRRLAKTALAAVEGFGGVGVVDAAGHTPGSQVVLAVLRGDGASLRLAFTGDVANHVAGIRMDVGKPPAYRLLVVPEWDERLGRVRRWLRHLEHDLGFELVVAHDRAQLEALGLPPFSSLRDPGAG